MNKKNSRARELNRWAGMIVRCYDKRSPVYKNYGARGIKVCRRWRNSFEAFHADMGYPPSDDHSLDRVDVNGNYEPKNCRWATQAEQCGNQRRSIRLTFEGRTQCLAQWSRERKLPEYAIKWRLQVGWSVEDALTIPMTYFTDQFKIYRKMGGLKSNPCSNDFPPGWTKSPTAMAKLDREGWLQREPFRSFKRRMTRPAKHTEAVA